MNAAWKPGLGQRDPFAAFLCDEATLALLRPVATDLGLVAEKCVIGGLRAAIQSLAVSASPAILMVDLSDSSDPLNEIGGLAEVCEPGTVVIALGRVNDVRLYRHLMASGIHDYLLKPVTGAQLSEALQQAKDTLLAPAATGPEAVHSHHATALIGIRGGVGASTLATSLGWLFSTAHRRPTALLDLDVHFGSAAISLDLEPGRGLVDAIANPGRIDGLFIERAMIRANDRLAILSAEAPIDTPLVNDGAAYLHLQEEFRHSFDLTVIDMPRAMLISHPHLLAQVNTVVLVTELTLPCARDTIRILSWLKQHAPGAQPLVVANKVPPGTAEIAKGDFESSIERSIDHLIPADPKSATAAAKLGKTLAEVAQAGRTGAALRALATAILGAAEQAGADPPPPAARSLLDRFDIKGLLAKKQSAS